MKKLISILLAALLACVATACAGSNQEEKATNPVTEKQTQTTTKAPVVFNEDDIRDYAEKELGISKIKIAKTTEGSFGTACIFHEDDGGVYADEMYLAVYDGEKIICDGFGGGAVGETLYANDIDGEEGDEIVFKVNTGGCGGAGSYICGVYKVKNDSLVSLYKPGDLEDTFTSVLTAPFGLQVKNTVTGKTYDLEFKDKKDRYSGVIYDDEGNPLPDALTAWFDGFCEFAPKDVDSDGIYEIFCRQYVSLDCHADCIGFAEVTIKYNNLSEAFEVIDSSYSDSY